MQEITPDWAFDRYEAMRHILPDAHYPSHSVKAANLSEIAPHVSAFVLDAFGVLNRGETPIEGAVQRMAELRQMGKKLVVLTNAASYSRSQILGKYHRLGFDFADHEVVSSRDLAFAALPHLSEGEVWGALAAAEDRFEDAPVPVRHLLEEEALYERAGGFLILSSARWSKEVEQNLLCALNSRNRPVIIANPDLVAPREQGLSLEPGSIAAVLAQGSACRPQYFGKPFPNAYDAALSRLPGLAPHQVAMVGDTLHTDVLGGAAAGLKTVLITDHGLFRGRPVEPYIARSGIRPDWILPTT